MKLTIFSDGGSRGNPGPAAYAYLVCNSEGSIIKKGARYLGRMTNNEAEYHGLLAGIEMAHQLGADEVEFVMDSELVVNHILGRYAVKAVNLRPLYEKALADLSRLRTYKIRHVPRENPMIKQADALVNQELDICTMRH
jgi:ribonuclease HI